MQRYGLGERCGHATAWILESPSPELGDLFCRLRRLRGFTVSATWQLRPWGKDLSVELRRVKSIGTGYSRARDQFLQTSDGDSSRVKSYGMRTHRGLPQCQAYRTCREIGRAHV